MADIQGNTVIWEWINNLCIWITGYNFQQLGGDTSKTAYEFQQRLRANSQRAASRLQGLENGPLKRSWMLTLANSLQQVTQEEWNTVSATQAKDLAALLNSGAIATDDYKFENGQITSKRFVEYFPVDNYAVAENFKKSKKRKLDSNSASGNTLSFVEKKGETSLVAAVPAHLFPSGDIAQMLAFTVDMESKSMLGDLKVTDQTAINNWLTQAATLMPVVPQLTPDLMFALLKQSGEDAGLDIDAAVENRQDSPLLKAAKAALDKLQALKSSPPQNGLAQSPQQMASAPQIPAPAGGQGLGTVLQTAGAIRQPSPPLGAGSPGLR